MKKIFLFLFGLFVVNTTAQNIPNLNDINTISDSELKEYWEQAKSEGYSLDQLKTLARAQGITESEILTFEKRVQVIENSQIQDVNTNKIDNTVRSIFGIVPGNQKDTETTNIKKAKLPIFGMSFFESQTGISNLSNTPQLNIATPDSYQLGPGDQIEISVWGASENSYQKTINTGGFIKINRIPPIYLSGLTVSQAKYRVKKGLSKIYSGINEQNDSYKKVYFDLNLSKSRSIIINLVGAIKNPGSYTLPSVISPLNAIFAAGGPTENGSFRNIKIYRNNKHYKSIDLYDYFVKGASKNISLMDQDVITVPRYESRVFVNGEFKETGIFELKEKETIQDLILYTGGFAPFGFKDKVFIESVDGINKVVKTVDRVGYGSTLIKDGDIVSANPVSDNFTNKIKIEGAVNLPGNYSLADNPNIKQLILNAKGLKDDALKQRAVVFRTKNGKENQAVPVSLEDELNNNSVFSLEPNDRLKVFSKNLLNDQKTVEIKGEINSPGVYDYYSEMTVLDLILMADGLKKTGSFVAVDLYRQTLISDGAPYKSIDVDLQSQYSTYSDDDNPILNENDLVIIRIKEGYAEPEFVEIQGLVKSPGLYSILNSKYSLYNLLLDSGGILPDGSKSGLKIRRLNTSKEVISEALENIATDSIGIDLEQPKDYIEFGVDIEKLLATKGEESSYNVILKNGDIIVVPKSDNTIEILGEVEQPTVVNYKKGLTAIQAINQAGGFTELAKRRGVFVVYQNGTISSNKKFFLFNSVPKLQPGATIVVPKKLPNQNKTSLAEIIGLTSTLATLAVLVQSL